MKKIIFLIILAILAAIFMPILAIWSLNTLFGLTIPCTIKTYFAALILSMIVYGKSSSK